MSTLMALTPPLAVIDELRIVKARQEQYKAMPRPGWSRIPTLTVLTLTAS